MTDTRPTHGSLTLLLRCPTASSAGPSIGNPLVPSRKIYVTLQQVHQARAITDADVEACAGPVIRKQAWSLGDTSAESASLEATPVSHLVRGTASPSATTHTTTFSNTTDLYP